MSSKYRTSPEPISTLPGGIPFIIGNEAAERFSFYGMKAILTVFMWQYLHLMGTDPDVSPMEQAVAVENYHRFTGWVYFTPIFGAILSDLLFGKYLTIVALSLVYCVGHLCLALMGWGGIPADVWLFVGLSLIVIGSGGIKPCVSAHVGDQFGKSNSHWLSKVYGWFYFSVNTGAFFSTLLTPWLLEWYGPHLAFGVPGILMAVATLVFWMGRHKFIHVPAGRMTFLKETFSWVGISALLRLSIIFIFIAVFWALFDQTGSTWVIQAEDLNRKWLGVTWLSSQIQAVNPVMILILIPIFSFFIYPAIDKVFKLTPIRKISIGLFVMIGGFAIVAILQGAIDRGAQPSIGWQIFAYSILTSSEVMVSITGLEFAYTQSPRAMKSFVLAFFLMSVALGNFFTMGVNSFIQVPDQVQSVTKFHESGKRPSGEKNSEPSTATATRVGGKDVYGNPIEWLTDVTATADGTTTYRLAGYDGKSGTNDDITVSFDKSGDASEVETSENELLRKAEADIVDYFNTHDETLPSAEEGSKLVSQYVDSWGAKLKYRLINRNLFRISSDGGDKTPRTPADIFLLGEVSRTGNQSTKNQAERPLTWREKRIIELRGERGREEVQLARGENKETEINSAIHVGGQTSLEGAQYFWFWTILMAATALLFVVVSFFYKPKDYLQEEAPVETVETNG